MEFRLVYQGPLPSASNSNPKPKAQHAIRVEIHKQLEQLWRQHRHLRHALEHGQFSVNPKSLAGMIADKFDRGGHKFIPLVSKREDQYCSLNILFLRRGIPGLIVHGGDLDNRLKTLFDALRVPTTTDGLPKDPSPDPVFCLLEDDDQITSFHVATDRILAPLQPEHNENNVLLVIHVHIYRGTNVSQVLGQPGSW